MTGSRRNRRTTVAVVLAALGIALGSGPAPAQDHLASLSGSFRRATARARGALVSVRVPDGIRPGMTVLPARPGPFGPVQTLPPMVGTEVAGEVAAAITGVVIDSEKGYILTTDRPTRGGSRFVVIFPDGSERLTSEVRRDPRSDLALLVVDVQGLRPGQVDWGDPARLEPGDWLIALGQPGVGEPSMSVGVFGARRRLDGGEFLETDVALDRIGSGGILVNLDGAIVGIGTDPGRRLDGHSGMGHAIPADRARRIAADLARFGQVRRGYLGLTVAPSGPSTERRGGSRPGVEVTSVTAGTPAAEAGVRPGDRILAVGPRAVAGPADLRGAVEWAAIGEDLALTLERQGQRIEVKVKPGALPTGPFGSLGHAPFIETRRDARRDGGVPQNPSPRPLVPGGPPVPSPPPPLVPPDNLDGPPEP